MNMTHLKYSKTTEIYEVPASKILENPNFVELVEEYEDEAIKFPEFPKANPDKHKYYSLESAGLMKFVAVYVSNQLVGFATILRNTIPHYAGTFFCIVESIFLAKKYRNTGLGLELLRTVELIYNESGAECLMVTAPLDSKLESLLDKEGYKPKSVIYFK